MKTSKLIKGGLRLLKSKITHTKYPLVVGMVLTNDCNLRCGYCKIYCSKEKELDTKQVLRIIKQLAENGCIRIGFTGGEPLLRKDLGVILDFCKKKKIETAITSNGFLVEENIDALRKTDLLILSLDGPEEVHDKLRGKGSFNKIIDAISIAKKYQIKLAIASVMSRLNKNSIDYLLQFSKENRIPVHYQFVSAIPLTKNDISDYSLTNQEKNNIANYLLSAKRKNKFILNSRDGLKELKKQSVECAAGKIFFRIASNGKLYSCWRQSNDEYRDLTKVGLKNALKTLPKPMCDNCGLADGIELALLYSLNPRTIFNIVLKY